MRENYTTFSGLHDTGSGIATYSSDPLPEHHPILKRGEGICRKHFLSFGVTKKQTAALLSLFFLLLTSIAGAQCTTAPVLVGASDLTATTAVLNWNKVAGAPSATYTVDVATDSGFTNVVTTASAIAASSYQVVGLAENTTYYFRVKVDNTTCGDFSTVGTTGVFVPKRGITPLTTTGYGSKVIANGTGPASVSTNAAVDGGSFVYYTMDYRPGISSTYPGNNSGLPVNRVLTTAVSGMTFFMQDYTANNSLRLPSNGNSGTISISYPQRFSTIYVAVTSGSGAASLTPVLNFADGSTYAAGATTLINWDNSATTAVPATTNAGTLNRVDRTGTIAPPTSTGNFKIFYFTINVPVAHQSKLLNSITFTKGNTAAAVAHVFALSGKALEACPSMASVSSVPASTTSFTASWALSALDSNAAQPTYTLEVFTDSNYTTPVSGSPYTGLTGTSYTVTGLPADATYYYRVKADGATCSSAYVTGSQSMAYCAPTGSGTYYTASFSTVGGSSNISNNSGASNTYMNYSSSQIVSVQAGSSFTYNGTKGAGNTTTTIFVDWNNDLDFDDAGETIATHTGLSAQGFTNFSGVINVPAGTTVGSHRLRVRSVIQSTTPTGCGTSTSGETEDYTLKVGAATATCIAPDVAAGIDFSAVSSSNITATVTAGATVPTGYLVVRSLSPSLSATPVTGTSYAVGTALGGGTVVSVSATAPTFTNFVAANTRYYFYVYTFNNGACSGPVYSTDVNSHATSCAVGAVASAASNVKNSFATLNWVSAKGTGGNAITYTVELYTDSGLTNLFGTYTVTDQISYNVTGLAANAVYYYRVKASADSGCGDTAYSATVSFKAENNYSPINLTGFNADVIAEGNGWAAISTNSDVDAGNYVYMSRDYKPNPASTALTNGGLPVNRTMASPTYTGLNFLMPDYKQNNAVRLTAASPSQELVFKVPTKLTNIYLAVTSGGAASQINGTILFDDNTTQAIPNTSVLDWFSSQTAQLPALAFNIGRVLKTGTNNEAEFTSNTSATGSNAKIFQVAIDIQPANQAKKIVKVTVNRVASGAGVPNIFAISGKVIGDCPTLTSATATAATSASVNLNWVLSTAGDGGAPTYTIETYSDLAYTTLVSTNTGITAAPYTVSGLLPNTTYYFRVKAVNAVCDSNYVTATATTLLEDCTTPGNATLAANATSTGYTGTVSAPSLAPAGYIVIRSTAATLTAAPANFTTYTVGATIGGGRVVSVGASTSVADTGAASNTAYYYHVYAYNSGASCSGPVYSVVGGTTSVTTCLSQTLVVGASNIRNNSATLNWTPVSGVTSVTYNLEVYTDNTYTTLFTSFNNLTTTKMSVTGLSANATYYYRVNATAPGACSSTYSTGSFAAINSYTPIDVTTGGYNHDVIANGSGAAKGSTSASVDATGADNAYVALNYVDGNGVATTAGLPVNRFLASTSTSGLNFIIPDYSGNNSLRLPAQNDTGTLTFETPVKLTDLYIATTGGSGGLTASAEIIFEDGGTSQLAPSIAIPDWVTGTGSVIVNNLGRANRVNTVGGVETIATKIFQIAIPVTPANQTRKVASVKFIKTSSGEPVFNIFAISGKIIGDCPTMVSTSVVNTLANGANISWVLGVEGDGGAPTYSVEVYANPTFTTQVGTTVTGISGTTYAITGLVPVTTYYYRVKATNTCDSGYVTGSFTTSQIPATLNYTEGFEGANEWSLVNGSQANKWFVGTATSNTGTQSLYISDNASGSTYSYNIGSLSVVQAYRDIAIPDGTTVAELSFDWKAVGEGTNTKYDYLRVWIVPTTFVPQAGTQITAGNGRIQVGGYFNQQQNYSTFFNPTFDLSSFAGQNMRLVFEWRNDDSMGAQPPASIDNVYVGIPSCVPPSDLAANATLTGATLSWTAPSAAPANGFEYYYSTVNTAPVAATAGTVVSSGTTATITGLPSNTTYYYWVRSNCGDAGKSLWVNGGSFFTGYCTPVYSSCDGTHRITLVTVAEIAFNDNLSAVTACSAEAINRTNITIPVTTGNTYTFAATSVGFESVGLAIDFNGNASFNDAGEIVALPLYVAGNPQVYTMEVAIPLGATPGSYRLRIWNREANAGPGNVPCGNYGYGTYVDYTLVITAPCYNWTGVADSAWTNTANWCGGVVPTATDDVVIAESNNNPVITTGTAYAHSLTVGEGAALTVATGANLSVEEEITVHPAGTLTVQDNGALLQGESNVTNSNIGNIIFHKKSNALYRYDYTMWGAPVAGQKLLDFSPATSANRFYRYNPVSGAYAAVVADTTDFSTGRSYLIRMPNLLSSPQGYNDLQAAVQFDGTFTGVPNNGTIAVPLSSAGDRYNAVGNPYPSPINIADFYAGNSTTLDESTGIYLWRKRNNGANPSYATITQAAYVANTAEGGGAEQEDFFSGSYEDWTLAPGQGFLVRVISGVTSPVVNFTNSMRRATPGSSQAFLKQSAGSTPSRLWVNLVASANGAASQAAVAYMQQGTLGLDYGFDGKKVNGSSTIGIYSIAENTPLAVQARPVFDATDVVQMGYNAPAAGTYTISLHRSEGVFKQGQIIYLRDNAEGVIRNLSDYDYTFTTEAGTIEGRFDILYQNVTLGLENPVIDESTVVVYKQGNTVKVATGNTLMNGVTIYDIRGRKIYSQDNINSTQTAISNLSAEQQVLIVEVNTVKGKVSKRIVF